MKFVTFGPVVSEEKSFESVDGRRTTDYGRTTEAYHTISSPGAFGSGELKTGYGFVPRKCGNLFAQSLHLNILRLFSLRFRFCVYMYTLYFKEPW